MMRRAAGSVFVLAVVLSLVLHAAVMVSPSAWWAALMPAEEVAFPLDAVLEMPSPAVARPVPARVPVALPRSVAEAAPVLTPVPAPAPVTASPVGVPEVIPPLPSPIPVPVPVPAPVPTVAAPPVVAPPATAPVQPESLPAPTRPVLRQLPERMTLTYAVVMGENGFKAGRSIYEWRREGGRYSLKSRTEASGVLALFVSGQIVQESSGELGADGLRPDEFRFQRGDRRNDLVRFDRANQQLVLNGEAQPMRPQAQDLLSFPFHLGLTLNPEQAAFILPVTDGRKLRGYRVSAPIAETQDGRQLWRLHAWRDGDGEIDLWFDLERGGLPLRIRSQDSKGQVMTLSLEDGR